MKKTYILLFALFFTFAVNAQMVLEYEIPEAGKSIALPLYADVDVTVDWGDTTALQNYTTAGNKGHVYETSGTKTVTISGTLTNFGSLTNRDGNQYLLKVISWNGLGLTSLSAAFYNAYILTQIPNSLPETVTDLASMFLVATSFNQSIASWDTKNVTNMYGMFEGADKFNQPIGDWNTSSVSTMEGMFSWTDTFNQPLGSWNTASVINMEEMFFRAESFNQPIGSWNTGKVTTMNSMFEHAKSFNQPLGSWNTENVTDMSSMFSWAKRFNQPIGEWDTKKVLNMGSMFSVASSFNQNIENWNTSAVTYMGGMFSSALSFNQPLEKWDVSSVTNFGSMFSSTKSFNQPIEGWETDSCTQMGAMFRSAKAFNQPIEGWNTSNVTSFGEMFYQASSFNQPLGNWDISSVERMGSMFSLSSLCTENYDATLNGWASQTVQEGVQLHGGYSKYSEAGADARVFLAEKWSISDSGLGITEDDKCATPVGTEGYFASGNVDFYPNPVSDKLYISTTSLSSYAIYNLTGNLLKEAEGSKTQIDLSDLPSGVYILQTESKTGVHTQRFTKQ